MYILVSEIPNHRQMWPHLHARPMWQEKLQIYCTGNTQSAVISTTNSLHQMQPSIATPILSTLLIVGRKPTTWNLSFLPIL